MWFHRPGCRVLQLVWFVFVFMSGGSAWGQDWCANLPSGASEGGFELVGGQTRTCNRTVMVRNTTPSPDNVFRYVYDYRGGDPTNPASGIVSTTETRHVYPRPGRYTILQIGSTGATGSVFCRQVEILDTRRLNATVTACANRQVQVNVAADDVSNQYDAFRIDWGDGTAPQLVSKTSLSTLRTYPTTAPRTITVWGIYQTPTGQELCPGEQVRLAVTPLGALPTPRITSLTTQADGRVAFELTGVLVSQSFTLQARVGGGTFAPVGSFTGPGSFTLASPVAAPACFRAVVTDACGSAPALSPEVCSIALTVNTQELENTVSWSGEALGIQRYQVFRNGASVHTATTSQRQ